MYDFQFSNITWRICPISLKFTLHFCNQIPENEYVLLKERLKFPYNKRDAQKDEYQKDCKSKQCQIFANYINLFEICAHMINVSAHH